MKLKVTREILIEMIRNIDTPPIERGGVSIISEDQVLLHDKSF